MQQGKQRQNARERPPRKLRRPLRLIQLRLVQRRLGATVGLALYGFLNGALSMAILAGLAHYTDSPMIFPSLGPTAFLLFFSPLSSSSSPRNTVYGHVIGAAAGWSSLALFGLLDSPSFLTDGVTVARVGAAALSLGLTSGLMVLTRSAHPPAGATTLIVSLGLMSGLWELGVLLVAVLLLVLQALTINRLAGIPYPLWAGRPGSRS